MNFECEVCGTDLIAAESQHLGRCLECRYDQRNRRLANVVEAQRARAYVLGRREDDARCRRCGARAAPGQLCTGCEARVAAVEAKLRELDP